MNSIEATEPHRKSGMWGTRVLLRVQILRGGSQQRRGGCTDDRDLRIIRHDLQ
jgi:hypothetical protein